MPGESWIRVAALGMTRNVVAPVLGVRNPGKGGWGLNQSNVGQCRTFDCLFLLHRLAVTIDKNLHPFVSPLMLLMRTNTYPLTLNVKPVPDERHQAPASEGHAHPGQTKSAPCPQLYCKKGLGLTKSYFQNP